MLKLAVGNTPAASGGAKRGGMRARGIFDGCLHDVLSNNSRIYCECKKKNRSRFLGGSGSISFAV
jgi:hypothetical protein